MKNSILQFRPVFNPKALTGILKITLYNHDKKDKFSCLGMFANIDSDLEGITIRIIDNFEQFEDNTKDYICYDSIDNKLKTYKVYATEINNKSVEIKRIYATRIKSLYEDETEMHVNKESLTILSNEIINTFLQQKDCFCLDKELLSNNIEYVLKKVKEIFPDAYFYDDAYFPNELKIYKDLDCYFNDKNNEDLEDYKDEDCDEI